MKVVLYTTHCPKCNILKEKLDAKNIKYEEIDSIDDLIALGFKSVPYLKVDNSIFDFVNAIKWINNLEV